MGRFPWRPRFVVMATRVSRAVNGRRKHNLAAHIHEKRCVNYACKLVHAFESVTLTSLVASATTKACDRRLVIEMSILATDAFVDSSRRTDISREQARKLDDLNDADSINEFFIKVFELERNTKRTIVLCDLFYYALQFARNNQFNQEQTSAFLSILKRVHDLSNRRLFRSSLSLPAHLR